MFRGYYSRYDGNKYNSSPSKSVLIVIDYHLIKFCLHSYPDGEIRIVCVIVWPDGLPTESQQDFM